MKSKRQGFTLVELLVVIGIIALLLSILLPSLNKVRETARSLKCLSNMRTLGTYSIMYNAEYKNAAVPWSGDTLWKTKSTYADQLNDYYWHQIIAEKFMRLKSAPDLPPYPPGTWKDPKIYPDIFACPTVSTIQKLQYDANGNELDPGAKMRSYAINIWVAGGVDLRQPAPTGNLNGQPETQANNGSVSGPGTRFALIGVNRTSTAGLKGQTKAYQIKISSIKSTSNTMLFCETINLRPVRGTNDNSYVFCRGWGKDIDFVHGIKNRDYDASTQQTYGSGYTNMVFVDGHAEAMLMRRRRGIDDKLPNKLVPAAIPGVIMDPTGTPLASYDN